MDWNKRKRLPGIRGNIARLTARYEGTLSPPPPIPLLLSCISHPLRAAVPARRRLLVSSWAFLLCLAGLYWTDYLIEKYPPTEKELQRIQEAKKEFRDLRIPGVVEFEAARVQAEGKK